MHGAQGYLKQATPSVGQATDVGEPSVPSEAVLREIAHSQIKFQKTLGARRIELRTRRARSGAYTMVERALILNRIGKGSCETHGKRRRI